MTSKLVECIPNFSEGRRMEIIDEIVSTISSVGNVILLDRSSDHDHNRTVITFAGVPEAVVEAAFASIAKAAELIDLDHHEGEHPRLGATDVVPLVPLGDSTMEECVSHAQGLGQRVGEELKLPVYLYEEAATRPERKNLEFVRRGEYELLKEEISSNPDRAPDFGPGSVGKAGAVIIGARQPLIAYNVYLSSENVKIAQDVARAIRHSSGGLRFVKALGMDVEGRAQVSMNLTDYTRTPVARVQEMIRTEAARYGTSIHHAELVGLIPERAVVETVKWYLQLDEFESSQILETRLREKIDPKALFLEQLAEASPTPGGGSAAAYCGAMAAALVGMVAKLTIGKKKYSAVEMRMQEIAVRSDALRAQLAAAVQEDADAFNQVLQAYRLPKETEEEKSHRIARIQEATQQAAEIPLSVAAQSLETFKLAIEAAEAGNVNAISDAAAGASLANASIQAAEKNVRINTQSLKQQEVALKLDEEIRAIQEEAKQLSEILAPILAERAQL